MAGASLKTRVQRFGRILGQVIAVLFGLWAMTLLLIAATEIFWPDDRPPPAVADAIICLGAGLSHHDRQLPGPASERRALTCAALQAAGAAPVVVFSGAGSPDRAVADAMADRALAAGLPPEAILREPASHSTIQNAAFSLALLDEGTDRVIVVSDPFHLPRAFVIFKAFGLNEVVLHAAAPMVDPVPHPDDRSIAWWVLRESAAIWFNLARAAAYGAGGALGIDRETRIAWFD
jgi:uncharacterized SAM-binding protein YcdF (DUF218 family)